MQVTNYLEGRPLGARAPSTFDAGPKGSPRIKKVQAGKRAGRAPTVSTSGQGKVPAVRRGKGKRPGVGGAGGRSRKQWDVRGYVIDV